MNGRIERDPVAPARGVLTAVLWGAVLWIAMAWLWWAIIMEWTRP